MKPEEKVKEENKILKELAEEELQNDRRRAEEEMKNKMMRKINGR